MAALKINKIKIHIINFILYVDSFSVNLSDKTGESSNWWNNTKRHEKRKCVETHAVTSVCFCHNRNRKYEGDRKHKSTSQRD